MSVRYVIHHEKHDLHHKFRQELGLLDYDCKYFMSLMPPLELIEARYRKACAQPSIYKEWNEIAMKEADEEFFKYKQEKLKQEQEKLLVVESEKNDNK